MKVEQVLELVKAVSDSALTELKYEEDGVKLSLKKTQDKIVQVQAAPPVSGTVPVFPAAAASLGVQPADQRVSAASGAPAAAAAPAVPGTAGADSGNAGGVPAGNVVKSPLVGTFYAAPSEDAEPFVKVGDHVEEGQVLAIVEAMKLMNEIESDFTGTVKEILVENAQAVEYGQPLFVIG